MLVRYEVDIQGDEPPYHYTVYRVQLPSGTRFNLTGLAGEAPTPTDAVFDASQKARAHSREQQWRAARKTVHLFEVDESAT